MRSTARETAVALRYWLVFLLATVPAAGVVAGGGPCFSVSVSETVVLPDGSVHDAGSIRICVTHAWSPVSAIHKIYVDREHVAMVASSVGGSEGLGDGAPFVMFHRDTQGRLHLYGFGAPDGGRLTNYLLRGAGSDDRRNQRSNPTLAHASDAGTVLIAARDSRTVGNR